MRARILLGALLLVTTSLAGCLGGDDVDEQAADVDASAIDIDEVPDGATLEAIENGKRLVWESVELPFEQTFEVPAGATMVKVHGVVDGPLTVDLEHADTGRRRCNVPYWQAWYETTTDEMTCSGLTAVDVLPTNWTATVTAPTPEDGQRVTADLVSLEFLDVPLEGPVSKLDLSKLSMPTHEIHEPEEATITSHDGTELYAQVTVPKGEGPWPVIISSSPYNSGAHTAGEPSMWEYFVKDWAKRGYAVVSADVRGTGRSDGCMQVWGEDEQMDQKVLVDWAAEQDFSDGHVGFYGQSYVGTTPVQAAVQTPDALDAIIAVAPVINAYDDWHFGGVPNGENLASPAFYQASTGGVSDLEQDDPARSAVQVANGVCDPTVLPGANDPRAIYDDYYDVRNFSQRADAVEAATLYTHGFHDTNVKTQMITHWFNAIDAPKMAMLGPWVHQHPVRADNEVLFLAWMDEHVKGKAMGFEDVANVTVTTNDEHHRTGDTWPPTDATTRTYHADLSSGELTTEPAEGSTSFLLDPTGATANPDLPDLPRQLTLTGTVDQATHISGQITLDLAVSLEGATNAHLAAYLYETGLDGPGGPDDRRLVTFGMLNLAHEDGHRSYAPVTPGQVIRKALPMNPTEHELSPGDELELVLRGAQVTDWSPSTSGRAGIITVEAGPDGTQLDLPVLLDPATEPRPAALHP